MGCFTLIFPSSFPFLFAYGWHVRAPQPSPKAARLALLSIHLEYFPLSTVRWSGMVSKTYGVAWIMTSIVWPCHFDAAVLVTCKIFNLSSWLLHRITFTQTASTSGCTSSIRASNVLLPIYGGRNNIFPCLVSCPTACWPSLLIRNVLQSCRIYHSGQSASYPPTWEPEIFQFSLCLRLSLSWTLDKKLYTWW